ncbi:MAG TPA: MarR family transcriptional regulator, partial [Chloroflexota bacterium]|nr:MarR family transcriptional regulator [Chloroflexota bacterium]
MSTPTPAKPGASPPAAGDSASALVEQGVEAVTRLRRVLEEATATRWLKLELTLSQLKTVFTLDRMERVTISELAQHLGVGSAATSVLVDRLVRLKLAGRTEDPADRRRTFVSLTSRGRDLVAELRHGGREGLRQVVTALSPADLAARGEAGRAPAARRRPRRRRPPAPAPPGPPGRAPSP